MGRAEKSADRTDILLGVYEAERSDEQNTATLLTAIGTGVLAYIVGAAAYLADPSSVTKTPWWVLLATPFPLLILMAYTTFQYAASRLRQSYVIYLEGELSRRDEWRSGAGLPGYMALQQGLFAGKSARQSPFVPLTVITFLSHVLVMAVFTTFVLWKVFVAAERQVKGTGWWTIFWTTYLLMVVLYTVAISLNLWAMLRMVNFTTDGERNDLTELRREARRITEAEKVRWNVLLALPDLPGPGVRGPGRRHADLGAAEARAKGFRDADGPGAGFPRAGGEGATFRDAFGQPAARRGTGGPPQLDNAYPTMSNPAVGRRSRSRRKD